MDKLKREIENPLMRIDQNECQICLIPMENCLVLNCKHRFHKSCLYKWAETQGRRGCEKTCPTCRDPIQTVECTTVELEINETQCCCFF